LNIISTQPQITSTKNHPKTPLYTLKRPSVLHKLPLSCNLIYEILRTSDPGNGVIRISQRDLAHITRYSKTQVRRALRRLRGVKILRLVDCGGRDRKAVYYLRWKSYPQKGGPLTTREDLKDINHTKEKPLLSTDSFKNTPKTSQLSPRDKKKLSFIARTICRRAVISPVLDVLWQRDAIAGVWLDAIRGLQGLTVDVPPEELVWRSRKAVAALVGGLTMEAFEAIMRDRPATRQEATGRELAEVERRLTGLERWRDQHEGDEYAGWYIETREELYKRQRGARPCGIPLDDLLIDWTKPVKQPRPSRPKRFILSKFYTGKRTVLDGEALQERKDAAKKILQEGRKEHA